MWSDQKSLLNKKTKKLLFSVDVSFHSKTSSIPGGVLQTVVVCYGRRLTAETVTLQSATFCLTIRLPITSLEVCVIPQAPPQIVSPVNTADRFTSAPEDVYPLESLLSRGRPRH